MKVIFHTSNSSYGNAAIISKWHTLPPEKVIQNGKEYQGNGWDKIGYHYVILNGWLDSGMYNGTFDGHLETGRPLNEDSMLTPSEYGAHTMGVNDSIGICLIGLPGKYTDKQIATAKDLLGIMKKQFKTIEIYQHSDFDVKKPYCASLDLSIFKDCL